MFASLKLFAKMRQHKLGKIEKRKKQMDKKKVERVGKTC